MRALILEDNRDRRVAMIGRLAERFPFLQVTFFDASDKMIEFMQSDSLQDLAMISLDHDLELIPDAHGKWLDPGTGLDVARWLSKQPKPICPVVVHTTNSGAGGKMVRLLEKSHWVSHRVIPYDDLRWIDADWFRVVRNAIVEFAPQRRSTLAPQPESKIAVVRSLLDGQYDSGQAFCKAAMAKIAEAYIRDLRRNLVDASVEIISLFSEDRSASALHVEGPIAQWCREVGISLGNLFDVAGRTPVAVEQLPVDGSAMARLSRVGVRQIQVGIIEIAEMQALLIVSTSGALAAEQVQETITELTQAIEIAIFIGLHWRPLGDATNLTTNKTETEQTPAIQPRTKGMRSVKDDPGEQSKAAIAN